jgi:hypothetical protein
MLWDMLILGCFAQRIGIEYMIVNIKKIFNIFGIVQILFKIAPTKKSA